MNKLRCLHKSLSSSTLDAELRMLQIIGDDDDYNEQEPENRPELITLNNYSTMKSHTETTLSSYRL
ncbi:hypothetical protein HanHA300_Chr06g0224231 [Helianthus annuus]|nr:hypothetical protein HanHA300_Chr06g0224231 [Helianthus annuus]KAJ0574617.1 hypothetical protein HanHA89_Chr06g0240191 [Helianthus annuus]KAJ0738948.1 hypothetical protein HanLR1_Chr06g0224091 [Helianthus annuus]KAJ0741816.1 hypothetical protein HanOQP8_Chr06g0232371 [Helianthus annuus]